MALSNQWNNVPPYYSTAGRLELHNGAIQWLLPWCIIFYRQKTLEAGKARTMGITVFLVPRYSMFCKLMACATPSHVHYVTMMQWYYANHLCWQCSLSCMWMMILWGLLNVLLIKRMVGLIIFDHCKLLLSYEWWARMNEHLLKRKMCFSFCLGLGFRQVC